MSVRRKRPCTCGSGIPWAHEPGCGMPTCPTCEQLLEYDAATDEITCVNGCTEITGTPF